MRAGSLKYKLRILRPVSESTGSGAERSGFAEYRTVRAERVRLSGRRSEEVGEHFADYSAQFRIRDAHAVDTGWRVEQLGGHVYNVVAVEPDRDRGFLTLICERLNP